MIWLHKPTPLAQTIIEVEAGFEEAVSDGLAYFLARALSHAYRALRVHLNALGVALFLTNLWTRTMRYLPSSLSALLSRCEQAIIWDA
jgi:hypothetical protein